MVGGDAVDASKNRKGRDLALALAKSARTVVVARGKKVLTFDMSAPPDDDELAAALLGRTGNLKAPTLRVGSTLLVGFGEAAWRDDGTFQEILDALRKAVRKREGREESPSAACVDSQTVKSAEMGGEVGYDGGKRIKGRKRHIVVDTLGLLLMAAVTAANLDEGTYAWWALDELEPDEYPRLEVIYADSKHNNETLKGWLRASGAPCRVEVVSKREGEKGFRPLKIRWVNEQAFGCLGRYRRLSKDHERTTASSESWVRVAAISRMLKRLKPDPNNRQEEFKYPKKEQRAA